MGADVTTEHVTRMEYVPNRGRVWAGGESWGFAIYITGYPAWDRLPAPSMAIQGELIDLLNAGVRDYTTATFPGVKVET
jgi:hypothetical protein